MRLTIDNLDGLGAVDYSGVMDASGPLRVERVLNAPSLCHGTLCLVGTALTVPVRRGRVVVSSDAGTVVFTGYIATEPVAEYAGVACAGAVYRLAFGAVSDEWLLDRQAPLAYAGNGFGVAGSAVVARLVQSVGGGLATSGLGGGRAVGVFTPEPAVAWSANAGAAAAAGYGAYRAVNGAVGLVTVGSVTHEFDDGDGSLALAALKSGAVKELANDVTVSGEIEPWQYVTEVVTGDGTTTSFAMSEAPFRPKAGLRTLANDSFNTGAFDGRVWSVNDPGSHVGFSSGGLALSGGNGFDGQTTLTLIDELEMGGSLVLECGNTSLSAGSDGVVCGLYQGAVSRTNCFAGYNVRQVSGQTVVVPFVDGSEVGTAYTLLSGHRYTLRLRLHCKEVQRVLQSFYATVDGVLTQYGGGYVSAPMAVVFELVDVGVASNTPATVLYDGTVAASPAACAFVPVNSVQLFGSIGYVRATQAGSAWVTSVPPGGVSATRLIGVAGEGVDCEVSATGLVTFFAGRVPVAGEIVTVTYRGRRRAVARARDAASIAAEAAGGGFGTAAWLGRVLKPPARSSADCEATAAAVLGFASSRAASIAGSYTAVNCGDVWPGDVLALTSNGGTLNGIVRKVTVENLGTRPEALRYRMSFANDWAEGLGLSLAESFAADALVPASSDPAVIASLSGLSVVSVSSSVLQIDAGVLPPGGGGFEVRRRDGAFGASVEQDLVLRSAVRSFSVPRSSAEDRFYVRMFDGAGGYSRCSAVVKASVAVG